MGYLFQYLSAYIKIGACIYREILSKKLFFTECCGIEHLKQQAPHCGTKDLILKIHCSLSLRDNLSAHLKVSSCCLVTCYQDCHECDYIVITVSSNCVVMKNTLT